MEEPSTSANSPQRQIFEYPIQVNNSGIMVLVLSPRLDGGKMGTADEWADGLAREQEQKILDSYAHDKAVELRRQIIAEQWQPLWEEIAREFQSHCEAFNKRLNPERKLALHPEANGFIVRPDALGEIVRVHHDPQAKRIEVRTPKSSLSLGPEVEMSGNGKLYLTDAYRKVYSPAFLAQRCIQEGTSR